MSNYPTYNKEHLSQYLANEDFVKKTVRQIAKNLNQFGYEYSSDYATADPLNTMISDLKPIVEDFVQHHQEQFMAYLYQVDLSEKELNSNEYGSDYIENVCYKIIRREAQKIFFQFLMANKKI